MNKSIVLPVLEKAMNGDKKAFNSLCELCAKEIIFMCTGILGNLADGEDAAQDVLLKMHKNLHLLRDPGSFFAWVNKIVYTTCLNLKRYENSNNPALPIGEDMEGFEEINSEFLPEEFVENEEKRKLVLRAMDNIAPQYKESLLMHYYQGLSPQEMSSILSVPVSRVYNNLYYGRKSLQKYIENEDGFKAEEISKTQIGSAVVLSRILFSQADIIVKESTIEKVITGTGLANIPPPQIGIAKIAAVKPVVAVTLTAAFAVIAAITGIGAAFSGNGIDNNGAAGAARNSQSPAPTQSIIAAVPENSPPPTLLPSPAPTQSPSPAPTISPTKENITAVPKPTPTPKEPLIIGFNFSGRIIFADKGGNEIEAGRQYTEGYNITVSKGSRVFASAVSDENGSYSLAFEDEANSGNYIISVSKEGSVFSFPASLNAVNMENENAENPGDIYICRINQNPGEAVPDVYISDTALPYGKVYLLKENEDMETADSDSTNPAKACLWLYDFTPCEISWEVINKDSGELVNSGSSDTVDFTATDCEAIRNGAWYIIRFTMTDIAGNVNHAENDFVLYD